MQRSGPVSLAEIRRRELGLSQQALAGELGWSQGRLSQFERSPIPDPVLVSEWREGLERVRLRQSGVGCQVGAR